MADEGKRVEVVGYMRTSSATNVGDGKDSEARQRKAIEGYAHASGAVIVDWFYDAAVSGADPIEVRPGFAELLARIADNGVRTIIVETGKPLRPRSHGPGSRLRNAGEPGRDAGCGGQPVILP